MAGSPKSLCPPPPFLPFPPFPPCTIFSVLSLFSLDPDILSISIQCLCIHIPDLNIDDQGIQDLATRKDGSTGEWRNGTWSASFLTATDQPQTLFEMFENSVRRNPDGPLFLRRPVLPAAAPLTSEAPVYGTTLVPTSYAAVQARRDAVGSALLTLEREGRLRSPSAPPSQPSPAEISHPGVPYFGNANRVKHGARRGWAVGIWSKNREEWQVVDFACHAYGLVGVSLYETLGPDVARYVTNHCPLSIVFCSSNHITSLLKLAPKCPSLQVVVTMDPLPRNERDVLTAWASSVQIELLDMAELEIWGQQTGIRCDPGPVKGVAGETDLDRDRISTISYTSGTTGNPKGVVLTNRNVTTAVISNALGVRYETTLGKEWRYISYLPLSHIYERFIQLMVMYADGTVAFTTGDILRLLEDAQIIKPHMMIGVPRVFNRIYAAIKAQMNAGGLKGALLTRAFDTKIAKWRATGEVEHTVYDFLVFRKIRDLLGGQLRVISIGAAPLSPDVYELLKVCFSCDIVFGYGMTESVGTCSKGIPHDVLSIDNVGQIQPCNKVKLLDVPDMGYTSKDLPNPRGEIMMKGTNIFPGYLHDPENTAKTIEPDGWMHTGDIGEIDFNGRLKIVDRIKNVIKLSQGEYVALEKLEGVYGLDPLFATLLVHGDSTRSSIIAIAVLDPASASILVSSTLQRDIPASDITGLEAAVQDKRIRKVVVDKLRRTAQQQQLNGFGTIKGVHLTLLPFPEEALTPTFKVKRNIAAKMFKEEIAAIYDETEGNADVGGTIKL